MKGFFFAVFLCGREDGAPRRARPTNIAVSAAAEAVHEGPSRLEASINSKNSLLEFTSSSLNNSWKGAKETDTLMVEEPFGRLGSYGKITLYPEKRELQIDLIDEDGNRVFHKNRKF